MSHWEATSSNNSFVDKGRGTHVPQVCRWARTVKKPRSAERLRSKPGVTCAPTSCLCYNVSDTEMGYSVPGSGSQKGISPAPLPAKCLSVEHLAVGLRWLNVSYFSQGRLDECHTGRIKSLRSFSERTMANSSPFGKSLFLKGKHQGSLLSISFVWHPTNTYGRWKEK